MDVTTQLEPQGSGTLGRSPAVRAATHRALAARDLRRADYPHWETWRRQARAIKTEALDRLEALPAELERAVTGLEMSLSQEEA